MSTLKKTVEFLLIGILTIPSSFVSAATLTDMVNGIQIVDPVLPIGVTNPKGSIGSLLAELFWGISDGVKNGKIKPQYLDLSGVSSQWILNGANISYTGGNVGIGTNGPAASLEIKRTITDGNFAAWIEGTSIANYGIGVNIAGTGTNTAIADFRSGNVSKFFVRADGKIGIGTSNPTAPLHIITQDSSTSGNIYGILESHIVSPASISSATNIAGRFASIYTASVELTGSIIGTQGVARNNSIGTVASAVGTVGNTVNATNGTITSSIGVQGNATNVTSGTMTYVTGVQGITSNSGTGVITNAGGTQGIIYNSSTGSIFSAAGAQGSIQNNSVGVISNAAGTQGIISNNSSGIINSAIGLASYIFNIGTGTIDNSYELYTNTINNGTITNQYGIFQTNAISKNYFAGNVGIGTTSPSVKLEVTGNIIASTPISGNHVATKDYVDTKVATAAGTAPNCTAQFTSTNTFTNICPASYTMIWGTRGNGYTVSENLLDSSFGITPPIPPNSVTSGNSDFSPLVYKGISIGLGAYRADIYNLYTSISLGGIQKKGGPIITSSTLWDWTMAVCCK